MRVAPFSLGDMAKSVAINWLVEICPLEKKKKLCVFVICGGGGGNWVDVASVGCLEVLPFVPHF